ncbi:MAG: hypothetical protein AAF267_19190 [Deinococcota bacterium]
MTPNNKKIPLSDAKRVKDAIDYPAFHFFKLTFSVVLALMVLGFLIQPSSVAPYDMMLFSGYVSKYFYVIWCAISAALMYAAHPHHWLGKIGFLMPALLFFFIGVMTLFAQDYVTGAFYLGLAFFIARTFVGS